ncbi:MAG: chromosome segregation protein ScpA [Verrucomicrobia bacterium]|nr:chromosome segregation protein ScpA [Verrucomicrobiota bacterium]
MATQDEYKVQLEVFEGPLDLLLYLIKKEEVDIYNIPIERITSQYIEYLNLMRMLDLNIAGEFIVMAATLMMIKSRMLLPVEDRPELEEEEDDPRWDLVRQLLEYKKFKDAAARLQEREYHQENIFTLGGECALAEPDDPGLVMQDITLFDLITAFNEVLKKAKPEQIGEIVGHQYTVADQIDLILNLVRDRKELRFHTLFQAGASRNEIICTFLGLLELIRLRQIAITQMERFGEIVIHGVDAQSTEEKEQAAGSEPDADDTAENPPPADRPVDAVQTQDRDGGPSVDEPPAEKPGTGQE